MKRYVVLFIMSVNLFCTRSEEYCAGPHEEYKECGYKCQKSCTNLDIAIKCVSDCDPGCFCKDGYVRHEDVDQCVKPSECPTCGKNESYKSDGFDCQTCFNYQRVRCGRVGKFGCYCLGGYVRDDTTGICRDPKDCP